MLFILCLKLFSFLTYLHFVEKLLDQKAMVNFNIYDATGWTKINYNSYIAQYLKK